LCRLFGLYANMPVDVCYSFYLTPRGSFESQSERNPNGWGVVWLEDSKWHLYKEAMPLYMSFKAKSLIGKAVRGRIVISHVRYASVGSTCLENTHPWTYRGWAFAHNGTIRRSKIVEMLDGTFRNDLEGETDSEALLHLVVQETLRLGNPIGGIKAAISRIVNGNVEFSSLNFIASDGLKLYALRYATRNLNYYTLYYISRPQGGLELNSLSKETRQLIGCKLSRGEKAVIVASEIMSDEPYWKPIPNKHLLVIDENLNVNLIPL